MQLYEFMESHKPVDGTPSFSVLRHFAMLSWQTIFRLVQKLLMDFLVLDPQGMCQCCVRKTSIDEQMHGEEKIREETLHHALAVQRASVAQYMRRQGS